MNLHAYSALQIQSQFLLGPAAVLRMADSAEQLVPIKDAAKVVANWISSSMTQKKTIALCGHPPGTTPSASWILRLLAQPHISSRSAKQGSDGAWRLSRR